MKEEIPNPTKEDITEWVKRIGWSIHHYGASYYYFYNHKNKQTGMRLCSDRIEIPCENYDESPDVVFYLKDLIMEMTDEECISFRGKNDENLFIQIRNFKR